MLFSTTSKYPNTDHICQRTYSFVKSYRHQYTPKRIVGSRRSNNHEHLPGPQLHLLKTMSPHGLTHYISRVSCQKGPFWQDTLDMLSFQMEEAFWWISDIAKMPLHLICYGDEASYSRKVSLKWGMQIFKLIQRTMWFKTFTDSNMHLFGSS